MKTVFVTTSWDDGHVLDFRLATLLKKYGVKGTFYVAPNDQESPTEDRLTGAQIKELSESFEIGGHTINHVRLPLVSDTVARKEIADSKTVLERITGSPVTTFCYPRGEYRHRHVEMVREAGYHYARTVDRFSLGKEDTPFEAATTVNTYNHYSDLWNIACFANFNPFKIAHYFQWDNLAKAMFDRVVKTGGEFHLWGHSWEVDDHGDWEKLESVLAYIAHHPDVQYVTNGELRKKPAHKLLVATPYFPPHLGGAQLYAYNITKRLQDDFGREVCVVTSGERGFKVTKGNYGGLMVYRLPYWFKILNTPINPFWFFMLKRIIKKERISIINAHAPVPGMSDISALASRHIPFILTYHGGSMQKQKWLPDALIWLYEHTLLPLLMRRADTIICSSDFVRQEFLQTYLYKSATITPAVDGNLFRPSDTEPEKPTLLFVASLTHAEEYKGLKTLIDAVHIVEKTIPEVTLNVVGDGDMKPAYEAYANGLGLKHIVRFKGRLLGEALAEEYRKPQVFILPSLNDSFPLVILEAMSSGLPVIATNVGSIPLLVDEGKTGFLVAPRDPEVLAEKIITLLQNPALRAQFGTAGRERAMAEFDWRQRATEYNDILTHTVDKRISVVQITPHYPPHLGGMEQRVEDLSMRLAEKDLEVAVLTSNLDTLTGGYIKKGVAVFYIPSKEVAHAPIAFGLFSKLFSFKKPDIIHVHVALAFFPEVAAFVAWLRKIPYIAHIRGIVMPSEVAKYYPKVFGALLLLYDRLITSLVVKGAAKVIVLTPSYSTIVHDRFKVPYEKIAVIPNATTFKVASAPRKGMHKPIRLLAVGRLSLQKNFSLSVKVAEALKKQHHLDFRLTIVGSGIEEAGLRAEVKERGVENEVIFAGEVKGETLEEMYTNSDILLHTSVFETFGSIFIEAMAKGLPIVASDIPGTYDVVKNEQNGLLAKLSTEDMCAAILRLVNDPVLYETISRNNIEDVGQYKWENIINKTLAVYKECIKKRNG